MDGTAAQKVGLVRGDGVTQCPDCGDTRVSWSYGDPGNRSLQCMSGHRFMPPKPSPLVDCIGCGEHSRPVVRGWFIAFVECRTCGCRGPRQSSREAAIAAWGQLHRPRPPG